MSLQSLLRSSIIIVRCHDWRSFIPSFFFLSRDLPPSAGARRGGRAVASLAMQQGEGSETEVTWEDQQNINTFGRLNNKFHELEDDIKLKKELMENLEDATNELILTDDEIVRFQLGEVFCHMPREDVEERLENLKEENQKELHRLEEEKDAVLGQMAKLKTILYGKFKDSINLEED